MKKICCTLILGLVLTFTASANVAVYKIVLHQTKTGQGSTSKENDTGYFILEPSTGGIALITIQKQKGTFQVIRTALYSKKDTSEANVFSPTLSAAVQNATQNLQNKGYTQTN